MAWSVGEALAEGRRTLADRSESAGPDAQALLAEVTGAPRERLLAHPETALAANHQEAFQAGLRRLSRGEPLPYVLGWWEFWGRRFRVTPDVLIPRPETELLVEQALAESVRRPPDTRWIDLGTGSGCLAVTLALAGPIRRVLATDVSAAALGVARENIDRYRLGDRVDLVRLDLASGLRLREAVVVANLPYVSSHEAEALPHEPRQALEAGEDGLQIFRRLFEQFRRCRPARTTVLLEIGASQSASVLDLARDLCPPSRTRLMQDLAGLDRVIGMEF